MQHGLREIEGRLEWISKQLDMLMHLEARELQDKKQFSYNISETLEGSLKVNYESTSDK